MNRKRWIARIGILGVSLLILLGGLELVAYIWEQNMAQGPFGWTLVGARRLEYEIHGSDDQPYALFRPDRRYEWRGTTVQINGQGLRGPEIEFPKPAGTTRILNLGDSIVFGWEVGLEESFGAQVAQMLNQAGDGQTVEVINAGAPGWSLETERNFLLDQADTFEPDALILSVAIVNDIGDVPVVPRSTSLFDWLRDNTYTWPFITTQVRFALSDTQGPEAIPVLNPPEEAHRYFPLRTDNPIYDRIWGYIEEMGDYAEERDIPFVVILFPTAFQINSYDHPDTAQRVLSERAAAAGIPTVDMLPIYGEACASGGAEACEGYDNLLFADVWMHPNATGHRLAAEALVDQFFGNLDF